METVINMEYVVREFDGKLHRTIQNFGVPSSEIEDVKADIYMMMHRRNICGMYDKTRAAHFSTFFYKVVQCHLLNRQRYKGAFTKTGKVRNKIPEDKLVSMEEVVLHTGIDEGNAPNFQLVDTHSLQDSIELDNLVEGITKDDPVAGKVTKMVLDGHTLSEIKRAIGVSKFKDAITNEKLTKNKKLLEFVHA